MNNKLFGQNIPSIQLDRPDQTECPFITPVKYIQVENGINYESVDMNKQIFTYPTSLWKYGVNDKLEFRLITEFVSQNNSDTIVSGFLPITLGFKTSLFEENGLIPKTSFIGHLTTSNIGTKEFSTQNIAPSFRFTMLNTLSDRVSLSYNLGIEWDGESAEPTYIYTLTSGYSLTKRLGSYV